MSDNTFNVDETTSFRALAVGCASGSRKFFWDPASSKEVALNTYYFNRYKRAEEELAEILARTFAQWRKLYKRLATEHKEEEERIERRRNENRKHYEVLLQKIDAWVPPTGQHRELKVLMQDSVLQAIRVEAKIRAPFFEGNEEFWQRSIEREARQKVEQCKREWAEEQERCKTQTAWMQTLLESLPEE